MSEARVPPPAASAALLRGDFGTARVELATALAAGEAGESADVHEMLATVCMLLEDTDAARRHGETAYRLCREQGDARGAAAAAIAVARVCEWTGNEAGLNGWLLRARRLLDEAGECVERGHWEVARIGCEVRDATALQASAAMALEVARRFGDIDLEVRALADGGLALVSQGMVEEGLQQLDEAMAAVVAGEVRNLVMAGTSCCAMLHACDRLGDLERARQWIDAVFTSSRERFGEPPPVVLQAHCRLMYGTLLRELGRWDEAEVEFRRARSITTHLHYRADGSARLADLCLCQGRVAEAAQLLEGLEDCFEVTEPLARLHLVRDEPDLAAATLRRSLRRAVADRLVRAPLLSLLVAVELQRGDVDAARTAVAELDEIVIAVDLPVPCALAELAKGRLAVATGEDATPHLHAALAALPEGQRPMLRAEVHLELAALLREQDRAGAIAELRAALAITERLGARQVAARAAAELRDLGVAARVRSEPAPEVPLSRREREVLALLGEGLSNAEIGRRLYITPKTAEHHVGAILGKLNVKSRAEAAVYAATLTEGAGVQP